MLIELNIASLMRCGKVGKVPEGVLPHVDLYPGINNLTPEDWGSIKDHPVMQAHLKSKVLVDGEKKPAIHVLKEGPLLASLKGLSDDEACSIASETLIVEQLVIWLNAETRQPVIRILENQLEEKLGVDLKTIDRTKAESEGETEVRADKGKRN